MIYTHTFPNGLRLIYEKSLNNISVSDIQIFCKVGSAMESEDIRGVSHLVEHMLFKGTKHRPLSKDISRTFDEIGAYFNATTEKSYTNYIVKCHDSYVSNCIIVLADMLTNSVFNRTDFEKEKKIVVEESILRKDNARNTISELVDSSIYKGTPYENPIDTLSYHSKNSLTYDSVVQFYKTFYRPNNIGISIVSNIPFSRLVKIIMKTDLARTPEVGTTGSVRDLSGDGLSSKDKVKHNDPYIQPCRHLGELHDQKELQVILHKRKDIHTMHLVIGFRACSQYSEDKYALNVLKNILGGYMNARLFTTLREKNGLTYTSQAYTEYYDILGEFTISAETDPDKILVHKGHGKGVLPLIVDIITDLQKNGVSKAELELSKKNLHGSMVLSEEINTNACFYNGSRFMLYDEPCHSTAPREFTSYRDRYKKYYKHITQQHIHDVIKKYLNRENMTLCILGKNIPDIKTIHRTCTHIL